VIEWPAPDCGQRSPGPQLTKGGIRVRRVRVVAVILMLVYITTGLIGCGAEDSTPTTETSATVEPGTGYLTEPPKKADDAASGINDKTQESQDAVNDLEGE